MGEKALVESHISDATELIKTLDKKGTAPTFAAWYFYDDADDWRLLIASSTFDELLKENEASAYHLVADALRESTVSSMSIADVKLVPSDSSLPNTVGIMIQTSPKALMRAHFIDNYVNGIFLKEMFVLRSSSPHAVPVV